MDEDEDAYQISVTEDGTQDIAESVWWAAAEGKPLDVALPDGRTVRLSPESSA